MAKVSIIVPFYNEETVLPRCLDAIIAQTYTDIEVLLADGVSTDKSGEIADSYAARDPRIRVIHQQKRNGVGGGRNAALAMATGEYVQFVDADDRIPPNMTAALVETIEQSQVDMVATGYTFITMKNGQPISEHHTPYVCDTMTPTEFLANCTNDNDEWIGMVCTIWSKLFRLSIIRKHTIMFEPITFWEDFLFVIKYLGYIANITAIAEPRYEYIALTPDSPPEQISCIYRYHPDKIRSLLTVGRTFEEQFNFKLSPLDMGKCRGALASSLIATLVGACRRDATISQKEVLAQLHEVASAPFIAEWYKNYHPRPGQSRLIPFLLKKKLLLPLYWLCRHKADKRYGSLYQFPEGSSPSSGIA